MTIKDKIFPCLSCGEDTGCANKIVCDKCRLSKRKEYIHRKRKPRHPVRKEKVHGL